jgi:hypothetical protein
MRTLTAAVRVRRTLEAFDAAGMNRLRMADILKKIKVVVVKSKLSKFVKKLNFDLTSTDEITSPVHEHSGTLTMLLNIWNKC